MNEITLHTIAKLLSVETPLQDAVVSGIATIQNAKPDQITFLHTALYRPFLKSTKALAVICNAEDAKDSPVPTIIVEDPYLAFAAVAKLFQKNSANNSGIARSAVVGSNCTITKSACICDRVSIGDNVTIGENVVVGIGTVIESDCVIDNDTVIKPNVTIYSNSKIGQRALIHSGVVIGADGFGFANDNGKWIRIPQLGGVSIGDDVEIGANTTIDRGALDDTIIHNGVKLDNQIQIGHNVVIGENTIMAGCVGVAGSAKVGANCMIGGGASINGHISLCDGVVLAGTAVVNQSVKEPGVYGSGTGLMKVNDLGRLILRLRKLDWLFKKVKNS